MDGSCRKLELGLGCDCCKKSMVLAAQRHSFQPVRSKLKCYFIVYLTGAKMDCEML